MNNRFKVLLISLIIILLVLISEFFIFNNKSVSKKEVLSLVDGSKNITNLYSKQIGLSDTMVITKFKDNIFTQSTVHYNENGNPTNLVSYYWEDTKSNEKIFIRDNLVFLNDNLPSTAKLNIPITISEYLNQNEYKYLNAEKQNNCIAVYVQSLTDNSKIELLIDKNTGTLICINTQNLIMQREIVLNCILDSDIQKPDISSYTIVE